MKNVARFETALIVQRDCGTIGEAAYPGYKRVTSSIIDITGSRYPGMGTLTVKFPMCEGPAEEKVIGYYHIVDGDVIGPSGMAQNAVVHDQQSLCLTIEGINEKFNNHGYRIIGHNDWFYKGLLLKYICHVEAAEGPFLAFDIGMAPCHMRSMEFTDEEKSELELLFDEARRWAENPT